MSIKPVAKVKHSVSGFIDWLCPVNLVEGTNLYAIPDTHRLVPVELLNRIMELAGVALVYQPFGTKDRQHFDTLMAIIEEKP